MGHILPQVSTLAAMKGQNPVPLHWLLTNFTAIMRLGMDLTNLMTVWENMHCFCRYHRIFTSFWSGVEGGSIVHVNADADISIHVYAQLLFFPEKTNIFFKKRRRPWLPRGARGAVARWAQVGIKKKRVMHPTRPAGEMVSIA